MGSKGALVLTVQAALFLALLAPAREAHFAVPLALEIAGGLLVVTGMAIVAFSALELGAELTPSPDPKPGGRVHAAGLYRFVRHPIYSGILLAVSGIVLRSGNAWTVLWSVVLYAFFEVKARYEERALARMHPGYSAYVARTPRFVPRPRR